MTAVKLKVAELRKRKGIGQQELAEVLGVTYQAVSKWETGITLPDIMLLPAIAEYFKVSVDELLGLKPLKQQTYIPSGSDNRDNNIAGSDKLYKNRKYFWNNDYLEFMINQVWKIHNPVNIIEFRCGAGYFGKQVLNLLPEGSTYTGVDSKYFVDKAKLSYENSGLRAEFLVSDLYSFYSAPKYDIAICQAGLRHMNRPLDMLKTMAVSVKKGGLVVSVDVNREFENDGFYFEGMNYEHLCTAFDFHKIWSKELELEGRDYAIGMRVPFYMREIGLQDIDIRVNDRVLYVNPDIPDYEEMLNDFIAIHGWDEAYSDADCESTIEFFMSRGINRVQAEAYIKLRSEIMEYFKDTDRRKSFLKVQGLLISYGRTAAAVPLSDCGIDKSPVQI